MRKLSMPFIALLALFCFAFAGCQQQKGASQREADQENQAQQSPSSEKPETAQVSGDQQFIAEASQDGRSEVELGQLAEKQASSPVVKRLAVKIVTDHTKANQQLELLPEASQALQSATPPPKEGGTADRLSQLSGKEFDRAFVEQVIQDHESAISRFKEAASSAQSPDVKRFASQTLPTLEQHLQMAKSAQKALGGKS